MRNLDYSDITSELCVKCGECCKIYIPFKGNERYIDFLKTIGIPIIMDSVNQGRVFWGYCPKIKIDNEIYQCTIYNNRPNLCRDFNCIAWAKYTDSFEKSELVARAQKLHEELVDECLCNQL